MIYGHQLDSGWSTRTLLGSVALGAAIGAGLGLLFAPTRGTEARRSLGDAASRLRSRLEVARRSGATTFLTASEPGQIARSGSEAAV